MDKVLGVPVMEQEQFLILINMLETHNMEREKKEVEDLAKYLDAMDVRLNEVLNELKEVKEQLKNISDRGLKASAVRVVTRVQGKMQEAKAQIQVLKERFVEGVNKTVKAMKENGFRVLAKTMDFVGIYNGLRKLHNYLGQSILALDRGIGRMGNVADEMHDAGTHIHNIGRALTGRETKKLSERNVEKGPVFQVQKSMFYVMGMMKGIEQRTGATLQKAEGMIGKTQGAKKPSVRESLQCIREEREIPKNETVLQENKQDAQITFYAAECMESVENGELRENLTLPEAVNAYREIKKKGFTSGAGIGFILRDSSQPSYWFSRWPLFQGGKIRLDEINQIPFYRDHPLVKQAVQDVNRFFPNAQKGKKHLAR